METYGNMLYDFCYYRMALRTFRDKNLQMRKVKALVNNLFEVVKAFT